MMVNVVVAAVGCELVAIEFLVFSFISLMPNKYKLCDPQAFAPNILAQ